MILDKGGHFPADQNGQPPCCPHLHDHNHRRRHHGDDDVEREIIIIDVYCDQKSDYWVGVINSMPDIKNKRQILKNNK